MLYGISQNHANLQAVIQNELNPKFPNKIFRLTRYLILLYLTYITRWVVVRGVDEGDGHFFTFYHSKCVLTSPFTPNITWQNNVGIREGYSKIRDVFIL
jgi:hypothetical protein